MQSKNYKMIYRRTLFVNSRLSCEISLCYSCKKSYCIWRTERSGGIWCASPYFVHFLSVLSPKLTCVTPIMPYLCLITITNVRATVGWRVKSENKKKIMKKQSKMVKNLHNCFNDLKKIICDNHMRSNASPIASGTCSGSQWALISWKNDTKVRKIWQ